MKVNDIMASMKRAFGRTGLKIKKHSPEILVVAGVAGVVTSTVIACRATTKLSGVIDEHKEQIEQINDYVENNGYSEKYSEEDSKNDMVIVSAHTVVKVVKLYAPAIILGALSITAIVSSHNILRKRNIALAAAYAVVDTNFKNYRSRVVERFGDDLDKELRYNTKMKEFEEEVVDENGETKTVKKAVSVMDDPNEYSDYARFFDDGCSGWTKNAESNLYFVKCQQNYANDILKSRGHLFLNEVYDMFGIPRTSAGQCIGWVYDEENPVGDNFVDFGIYDTNREAVRNFVNGYERTILLDFNVDGDILDLIG